jgi:rod shape-determining protein MreD
MYFLVFLIALFALFLNIFLNSAIPYPAHVGLLIIFFFISRRENKKAMAVALFYGFLSDCLAQITPFGTMIIFYLLVWIILNQITKVFAAESLLTKTIYIFITSFIYSVIFVIFQYASIYLFTEVELNLKYAFSLKYFIMSSIATTLIAIGWAFFAKIGTKLFGKWFFVK